MEVQVTHVRPLPAPAASKAFVVSFSEALALELKDHGVVVTAHCPGATATEFASASNTSGSRLFQRSSVAKPADVAAQAVRALRRGDVIAIHGVANKVSAHGARFLPRAVTRFFASYMNRAA